ncbi:MAG TPA: hypothetical protein VEV83_11045 [Parafilimonas sp.]|nr:hypothetical protein [Parafilimonas sp.]
MIKRIIALLMVFAVAKSHSQNVQFETKFSEPFAVFQFMNSLSDKSPDNVYKKLFNESKFSTEPNTHLIAEFDSLYIGYNYDFIDYPAGEKMGIDVSYLLRRNLILCDSLQDFKLRSMGLIPNERLITLVNLLKQFTPIYQAVIYVPFRKRFEEQLRSVANLIKSTNINYYFTEALQFYNSSWDISVPFVFCFYPLPNSRGFTATAVSNVAISAIADSLDNYEALLSVMLHEVCHVLYDERSLSLWNQMQEWFDSNPSIVHRYANSLFNEAIATAVANGYLAAQLNGKEDTTRRWYGVKYINLMAKTAYPLVKEYIEAHKPMDRNFVDRYIQLYEGHYSDWLYDPQYLMRGRLLISDNAADLDTMRNLYEPAPGNEDENEISEAILKKLAVNHGTKVIIVNTNNKEKLQLIKNSLNELKPWHYNAAADFVYYKFLDDKTWLIVLNNINGTTKEKLRSLNIKRTD